MIAKGTAVRQKVQPIEGVISDARLDANTGKIQYHVSYDTSDGASARWFAEDEVEAVEATKGEAK